MEEPSERGIGNSLEDYSGSNKPACRFYSLPFLRTWQGCIGEMSYKHFLNTRQNYHNFGIQLAFPKNQLNLKMLGFPSLVHICFFTRIQVQNTVFLEGSEHLRGGCMRCRVGWGGLVAESQWNKELQIPSVPCNMLCSTAAWQRRERTQNCQLSSKKVQAWSQPAAVLQSIGRARIAEGDTHDGQGTLALRSGLDASRRLALVSQVQLSVHGCTPQQNHRQAAQ